MYRAALVSPSLATPEAQEAVGDRLGRSPTRSCDRIRLMNIEPSHATDSARPAAGTAESEPASSASVRFSVRLGKLEDFAPLGHYLCELGCQVQALPAAADDLRLQYCF
jgi:hypothetical protein